MTDAGPRARWEILRDDWLPVIALLGAGVLTLIAVGLHRDASLKEAAGSKPYNLLLVYGLYVVVQVSLLYDPGASVQHRFLSSYRWFLCFWSLTYSEKVLVAPSFSEVNTLWIRGIWQAAFEGAQAWFLLDAVLALSHAPGLVPTTGGLSVRFVGWLRRVIVRRTPQDTDVRHWATRHLGVRSGVAVLTALVVALVPVLARVYKTPDTVMVEGIQSLPLGLVFALSTGAICLTLFAMRPQEYLPRSRPFRAVFLGLPVLYGVFQPAVSCLLLWYGASLKTTAPGALWELSLNGLYMWAGLLKVPYSFLVGVVVLVVRNLTRLDREVASHALSGLQAGVAVLLLPSQRLLLRNEAARLAFRGPGGEADDEQDLCLHHVLDEAEAENVLTRANGKLPTELIVRLGGRATIIEAARIDLKILSPLHDPSARGLDPPDTRAVLLLVHAEIPEDLAWGVLGEQVAVRDSQLFHEMRRPLSVIVSLLEEVAQDERLLDKLDAKHRQGIPFVFNRIRHHLYPQVSFLMLARKFVGTEPDVEKMRRSVSLRGELDRIVGDFQRTAASPSADLLKHLGLPAAARRLCASMKLISFDGAIPDVQVHVIWEVMDLVLTEALHNASRAALTTQGIDDDRGAPVRVRVTLSDDGRAARIAVTNAFVADSPDPLAVRATLKSRPRGGTDSMRSLSRLMPATLEADVSASGTARRATEGWVHHYEVRLSAIPAVLPPQEGS